MQTVWFSFALAAAAYASTDLVAAPTSTSSYELSATVRQCSDVDDKVLRCTCDRLVKDGIPVPTCCLGERFADPSACRRMLHDDRLYGTSIWSECAKDLVPEQCQTFTALFDILEQDRSGTQTVLDKLDGINATHTRGLEDILRVVQGVVNEKIETALATYTQESRQEVAAWMRSYMQQFNATSSLHTNVIRSELAAMHSGLHAEVGSLRTDHRAAVKSAADARKTADVVAESRHVEQVKLHQQCIDNTSMFAWLTMMWVSYWYIRWIVGGLVALCAGARVIYVFVAAVRYALDPASYRPKAVEPPAPKQPATPPPAQPAVQAEPVAQPVVQDQRPPRASYKPSKRLERLEDSVESDATQLAAESNRTAKSRRVSPRKPVARKR